MSEKLELVNIALANGEFAQKEKVKSYFDKVLEVEMSGEYFPVNLDHIWRIGFSRKDAAVRSLRKSYTEGVDYQVSHTLVENYIGRPEEVFMLSLSCMEHFAVKSNRDVFEVYRNCRKAIQNLVQAKQQSVVVHEPSKKELMQMWLALEEEKEQLQLQVEQKQLLLDSKEEENQALQSDNEILVDYVKEAKPKVDKYNLFIASKDYVDFETLAKNIAQPKKFGKNKILKFLRDEQVLMEDRGNKQNYPYASYSHLFKVTPTTHLDRQGIPRTIYEVLISPKGQEFIVNRAKQREKI